MIELAEQRTKRRVARAPGSAGAGRLRCGWRALVGSWGGAVALHAALLASAAVLTSAIVTHRGARPELAPVRLALGGTGASGEPGLPGTREAVASSLPATPDLPPGEIETGEPPTVSGLDDLRLGAPPSDGRAVHEDLMAGHIPEHSGRGRPGVPRGIRAGVPLADAPAGPGGGSGSSESATSGTSTTGPSTGGDSGSGGEGGDGWARRQGGRLPTYPASARRRGLEGTATLSLDIAADGTVTAVRLDESSGHKLLDDAATDAAWTWTFLPALREGRPQPSHVTMPVTFRLTD